MTWAVAVTQSAFPRLLAPGVQGAVHSRRLLAMPCPAVKRRQHCINFPRVPGCPRQAAEGHSPPCADVACCLAAVPARSTGSSLGPQPGSRGSLPGLPEVGHQADQRPLGDIRSQKCGGLPWLSRVWIREFSVVPCLPASGHLLHRTRFSRHIPAAGRRGVPVHRVVHLVAAPDTPDAHAADAGLPAPIVGRAHATVAKAKKT
mmetsp:Transcript_74444/g.198547  ORF Transcript_74444/g.198547 Transcript_74444/m.198547 type:complete len:203 (+) Transcript_74444:156-764(+)